MLRQPNVSKFAAAPLAVGKIFWLSIIVNHPLQKRNKQYVRTDIVMRTDEAKNNIIQFRRPQ